jgi:hypothetical protein
MPIVQATRTGGTMNCPPKILALASIMAIASAAALVALSVNAGKGTLPDIPISLELAPKTKRLYVLCYDSVQVVDLETLQNAGSIATPHRKTGIWESNSLADAPPSALAFDSIENRGFLSYRGDDELSVLDLKKLKPTAIIDWVSGWKNFGKATLAAAAMGVVNAGVGAGYLPYNSSYSDISYAYPKSKSYSSMAVDPKDRFLYVLGDSHIDVIDIATNRIITGISFPFFDMSFQFINGEINPILLVHGLAAETVGAKSFFTSDPVWGSSKDVPTVWPIDTGANKKLFDDNWESECFFTSDNRYAIRWDKSNIFCQSALTFSPIKSIGGFKRITQLLIAPQEDTMPAREP